MFQIVRPNIVNNIDLDNPMGCLLYTSTGEEKTVERRVSGYARTFSDAVTSFIKNRIRTSESAEICDLKREMEQLKKTVQGWEVK